MAETKPDLPEEEPQEDGNRPSYTPASPIKRTLAWLGVIYMVIIVALNTYALATNSTLTGIAGLMLAPAFLALAVIQFLKFRALRKEGVSAWGTLFLGLLGAVAGAYSLFDGVYSLLAQMGG